MRSYEKNVLDTVIFRVDFTNTINVNNEELQKKCIHSYPLAQDENVTEETINTQINSKGEAVVERQTEHYVNKRYSNRQMTRRIVLSPKFVLIELKDYISYEDTKSAFMSVFSHVREANPSSSIARIGMRYINHIDLSGISKTMRSKYIKSNLISSPYEDEIDNSLLARTQHLTEIIIDDFRVRCVTGLFNPDYPSAIKRHIVTLDYDAFIQGNADAHEVVEYLDKFHEVIQTMFESSILKKQRDNMVMTDD